MVGGDGFSGLGQKSGGGRSDHYCVGSCSYEALFIRGKAYQTIDKCSRWTETDLIDCELTNCVRLKSLSDKINEIRHHPGYKPSIDIVIQNEIDLLEGIEHLMERLFDEKRCKRHTCYRSLTLYVFAYDLCQMTKDNDIKSSVLTMVDDAVEKQEVDWAELNDDISAVSKWNFVRTLCLNLGLLLLKCYFFSFKSI